MHILRKYVTTALVNTGMFTSQLTFIVVMKVVDTRSSNSITGVYKVNTLTICKGKHTAIKAMAANHVCR